MPRAPSCWAHPAGLAWSSMHRFVAYLDPGSAGILLQMIGGGVAAPIAKQVIQSLLNG